MCGGTTVINESHGDWMRVMADYSWPVDLERASGVRPPPHFMFVSDSSVVCASTSDH